MFCVRMKRKGGFTLVELLIVIIVIGVLSAMMIIAANEIMATSRAATVISNLRNLKSAVTFWYVDNQDKIFKGSKGGYLVKYNGNEGPIQELWESRDDKNYRDTSGFKTEVLHYLNNAQNVGVSGGGYANANNKKSAAVTSNAYRLNDNDDKNTRDQWFIGYVISDGKGAGNNILKRKFAGRAKSLGLLQTNNKKQCALHGRRCCLDDGASALITAKKFPPSFFRRGEKFLVFVFPEKR